LDILVLRPKGLTHFKIHRTTLSLSTTVNVSPLLPYTTFTVFIFTKSTVNPAYGRRGRTLTVVGCLNVGESDEEAILGGTP
jgi:hypothetical protein